MIPFKQTINWSKKEDKEEFIEALKEVDNNNFVSNEEFNKILNKEKLKKED